MITISITCEHCGKDITNTGKMPAFRLKLSAEALPSTSGVILTVLVSPPIDGERYFCGLSCLCAWAKRQL